MAEQGHATASEERVLAGKAHSLATIAVHGGEASGGSKDSGQEAIELRNSWPECRPIQEAVHGKRKQHSSFIPSSLAIHDERQGWVIHTNKGTLVWNGASAGGAKCRREEWQGLAPVSDMNAMLRMTPPLWCRVLQPISAMTAQLRMTPPLVVLLAGERSGRASVADSVTVPLVMTSTYSFRDTAHLIDFEVSHGAIAKPSFTGHVSMCRCADLGAAGCRMGCCSG